MTHNLSFRYHADMTTKGLGSAKVEVLPFFCITFEIHSHRLYIITETKYDWLLILLLYQYIYYVNKDKEPDLTIH
jgi:hypothetical protein